VLESIGFLGYLFITEIWQLFIVQAVFGLAVAVRTPAFDGLYSAHLDKGRYASEWGVWESITWIVTGVSAFVGGFVVSQWGFDTLFGIMLAFSLAGLTVSLHLLWIE
jgi:hypothetical protein